MCLFGSGCWSSTGHQRYAGALVCAWWCEAVMRRLRISVRSPKTNRSGRKANWVCACQCPFDSVPGPSSLRVFSGKARRGRVSCRLIKLPRCLAIASPFYAIRKKSIIEEPGWGAAFDRQHPRGTVVLRPFCRRGYLDSSIEVFVCKHLYLPSKCFYFAIFERPIS